MWNLLRSWQRYNDRKELQSNEVIQTGRREIRTAANQMRFLYDRETPQLHPRPQISDERLKVRKMKQSGRLKEENFVSKNKMAGGLWLAKLDLDEGQDFWDDVLMIEETNEEMGDQDE